MQHSVIIFLSILRKLDANKDLPRAHMRVCTNLNKHSIYSFNILVPEADT